MKPHLSLRSARAPSCSFIFLSHSSLHPSQCPQKWPHAESCKQHQNSAFHPVLGRPLPPLPLLPSSSPFNLTCPFFSIHHKFFFNLSRNTFFSETENNPIRFCHLNHSHFSEQPQFSGWRVTMEKGFLFENAICPGLFILFPCEKFQNCFRPELCISEIRNNAYFQAGQPKNTSCSLTRECAVRDKHGLHCFSTLAEESKVRDKKETSFKATRVQSCFLPWSLHS